MLLAVGVLFSLFAVAVLFFQRRLIYFPTTLSIEASEQAAATQGLLPWRTTRGQIIGWHMPATGLSKCAVLVVHGNAGCALHREYFARPIHTAAPVDVFVLEYPGYGAREGSPSLTTLFSAADEAFDLFPTGLPIFIVGESLGAGVAAHLARTRGERVAGLILFAPYDNLVSVAQSVMPYLPVRLLLRDRFDPADDLKHYHGPVEFVLAGADDVIPPDSGRKLYDGYTGPKRIQTMPGARHNDIARQSPEWWQNIFAFWEHGTAIRPTDN
jgi:uncharacterized protein